MNLVRILFCSFAISLFSLMRSVWATSPNSGKYSIQLTAELEQTVSFNIIVNGETQTFSAIPVPNTGTEWLDFSASYGDNIRVDILSWTISASRNRFSYVISNGPGGSGRVIYNSKSTTFTPVNYCTSGTCQYRIEGVNLDGSTVDVFVNGKVVIANFDGSADQFFSVNAGDVIKTVFTYAGGRRNVLSILWFGDIRNLYVYNAFGEDAQIYSYSPSGGYMYPISQENVSEFATSIGAGTQSNGFIPLKLPIA
jgi:hypothetical protein